MDTLLVARTLVPAEESQVKSVESSFNCDASLIDCIYGNAMHQSSGHLERDESEENGDQRRARKQNCERRISPE